MLRRRHSRVVSTTRSKDCVALNFCISNRERLNRCYHNFMVKDINDMLLQSARAQDTGGPIICNLAFREGELDRGEL